jgi:hypothetical protein
MCHYINLLYQYVDYIHCPGLNKWKFTVLIRKTKVFIAESITVDVVDWDGTYRVTKK